MMPACCARTVAGAPADASTATATVSAAHVDTSATSSVAGIVGGSAVAAALSRLKERRGRCTISVDKSTTATKNRNKNNYNNIMLQAKSNHNCKQVFILKLRKF